MAWNNLVPAKCLTPKKPRLLKKKHYYARVYDAMPEHNMKTRINVHFCEVDAKQARRLAKWLLEAASYIEMSEK